MNVTHHTSAHDFSSNDDLYSSEQAHTFSIYMLRFMNLIRVLIISTIINKITTVTMIGCGLFLFSCDLFSTWSDVNL